MTNIEIGSKYFFVLNDCLMNWTLKEVAETKAGREYRFLGERTVTRKCSHSWGWNEDTDNCDYPDYREVKEDVIYTVTDERDILESWTKMLMHPVYGETLKALIGVAIESRDLDKQIAELEDKRSRLHRRLKGYRDEKDNPISHGFNGLELLKLNLDYVRSNPDKFK